MPVKFTKYQRSEKYMYASQNKWVNIKPQASPFSYFNFIWYRLGTWNDTLGGSSKPQPFSDIRQLFPTKYIQQRIINVFIKSFDAIRTQTNWFQNSKQIWKNVTGVSKYIKTNN